MKKLTTILSLMILAHISATATTIEQYECTTSDYRTFQIILDSFTEGEMITMQFGNNKTIRPLDELTWVNTEKVLKNKNQSKTVLENSILDELALPGNIKEKLRLFNIDPTSRTERQFAFNFNKIDMSGTYKQYSKGPNHESNDEFEFTCSNLLR